jgi:hypothetical protein
MMAEADSSSAPRKRAWRDRHAIRRVAPENFPGDQLVLAAEIGDARVLVLRVAQRQLHVDARNEGAEQLLEPFIVGQMAAIILRDTLAQPLTVSTVMLDRTFFRSAPRPS